MRMSHLKMAASLLLLVGFAAPAFAAASSNTTALPASLQSAFDSAVVNEAAGAQRLDRANPTLNAEKAARPLRPLTAVPQVWLEQEVTSGVPVGPSPPPGQGKNGFGATVAVKGDLAVIGAPITDVIVNGNTITNAGKAYVFTRTQGKWSLVTTLTASNPGPQGVFGSGVAVADADTILIASRELTVHGAHQQGAAYVFTKINGTWTQTQELLASDAKPFDQFGTSIAVDGQTAVIGASYADPNGNELAGKAYVFTEAAPDGTWTQAAILTADDGAKQDEFGDAVAISGDTILVGAFKVRINGAPLPQGAVYVFHHSASGWSQQQKLTDGTDWHSNNSEEFGFSVAVDGDTLVVGSPFAILANSSRDQGAAYVFANSGGTWNRTAVLSLHNPPPVDPSKFPPVFGYSVAISGNTIVAGNTTAPVNGNDRQGAVYVFEKADGGTWNQAQILTSSNGTPKNFFGNAVAMEDGGATILVGADAARPDRSGAAYFYEQANLALALSAPASVHAGESYVSQAIVTNSASAASPAVAVTVAIPAAATFVSANATSGSCSEDSGVVTCAFGQIDGNAGTATANVTLKASDSGTILNTASIAKATPALTASAPTTIGGNTPPVAKDGTLTTEENTAVSGTLKATDADGDALTFAIVAQPQHGKVKIDDATTGAYTYTPGENYSGSDSFTFKANDGTADSNTAKISITVKGTANHPPVASNGSLTTDENEAKSGTLKATDPDGDALTFAIVAQPQHGKVKIDDAATGAYTYTPGENYSGSDSFTFKASDGKADSNVAKISISVKAANHPPVASNGSLTTDEDTAASGTLKASDADGDALTFSIVAQPKHGQVSLNDSSTGAYTYTPADGYSGSDSFTFKANDGTSDSNVATISITVKAKTPPPPPPHNGGGGSFGWLALFALLALVFTAGYARRRGS